MLKLAIMQIGIFGGSFNPPHSGHLRAAQNLLASGRQARPPLRRIDEVWFMPCYAHVWNKALAPAQHRLAMLQFFTGNRLKVSTLEIDQKRPVYTVETLKLLSSQYPQHRFFWIIGQKSLPELAKWEEPEKVKERLIVVPEVPGISSTIIRNRIKKGASIKNLVPEKVREYIEKHKLYQ